KAGSSKAANSVILGAFTKIMGLSYDKMKAALMGSIPAKLTEINDKAFDYGYNAI
ncbi:MAG: 2-oxoacid:acceptor oxidoreductase family protein, partial [Clostridia bacterium]|nr:2-oxoacid:acceptor oxidoreductase family protein [Clostridia bacterium]